MKDKLGISFYHFATPLIIGLPKLIKRAYDTGQRLLVLCKTNDSMHELDRVLWTFASKAFIPHATIMDKDLSLQPVLLSTDASSNHNSSEILLSYNDIPENHDSRFKRYLYAFYGNADEVGHMVHCYNECKRNDELEPVFWKQDQSGNWSNPAL